MHINYRYEMAELKLRLPGKGRGDAVGRNIRYNLKRCMTVRFGSDLAQDRFIPLWYALSCRGIGQTEEAGRGQSLECTLAVEGSETALLTTGGRPIKAHILVVDDDPRITELLRRVLAYEDYSVAIAASGSDALDPALERPPDLIVLDIMLPGGQITAESAPCKGGTFSV